MYKVAIAAALLLAPAGVAAQSGAGAGDATVAPNAQSVSHAGAYGPPAPVAEPAAKVTAATPAAADAAQPPAKHRGRRRGGGYAGMESGISR